MASERLKKAYDAAIVHRHSSVSGTPFLMGTTLALIEAVEAEHPELLPPPPAKFKQGQVVGIEGYAGMYEIETVVFSQSINSWDYRFKPLSRWFPESYLTGLTPTQISGK